MSKYITVDKTFIKSDNKSSLIIARYFYSLLAFIILSIILYLSFGYLDIVISLLKSLTLSFLFASVIAYVINIIDKDYRFMNIYRKDNIHIISLIIGLLAIDTNILILLVAILVSVIIKKINRNINLSASLYGICIIFIYKYLNNDLYLVNNLLSIELNKGIIKEYLLGINYLNPILSLLVFIYLFLKKSIKYNIFIAYIITIFIIMLIIGIFNIIHIILPFIILASNSLLFLAIYTSTDYMNTPTINETQIIYGIILGILTSILTFIIYPFSVIIPIIIGPYILTKLLDNNSYRIKYHKK